MLVDKIGDFTAFKDVINKSYEVLVKFEADWCMPCKAMSAIVEELARLNPNVKVVAVDIEGDGMEEALKEYGIKSVPTFIHLKNGNKEGSTSGTVSKDELISLLQG